MNKNQIKDEKTIEVIGNYEGIIDITKEQLIEDIDLIEEKGRGIYNIDHIVSQRECGMVHLHHWEISIAKKCGCKHIVI